MTRRHFSVERRKLPAEGRRTVLAATHAAPVPDFAAHGQKIGRGEAFPIAVEVARMVRGRVAFPKILYRAN